MKNFGGLLGGRMFISSSSSDWSLEFDGGEWLSENPESERKESIYIDTALVTVISTIRGSVICIEITTCGCTYTCSNKWNHKFKNVFIYCVLTTANSIDQYQFGEAYLRKVIATMQRNRVQEETAILIYVT